MNQLIYIAGSGHSGSTLLDRLLGSHPNIAALGEIHRFSLGLHRNELPFRCDCGEPVSKCELWGRVIENILRTKQMQINTFFSSFETTDHSSLKKISGHKYFNANDKYSLLPRSPSKYLMALLPDKAACTLDAMNLLGSHLRHARNSHILFEAVRQVSEVSTIIDSTKNSIRMRALYLTSSLPMKVIYLTRDGRAVTNSRMKRQSISMKQAANIWVSENRKARLILKKLPKAPVLHVKYEDLCRNTSAELARIYSFADLRCENAHLNAPRHAIGGNPSRFDGNTVFLDESWRRELKASDLEIFDKIVEKNNLF